MNGATITNRRCFLRRLAVAGAAAGAASFSHGPGAVALWEARASEPTTAHSRVAVMHGDDRRENIFRALRVFEKQIARDIADRLVVIKPNNVAIDIQLSATHAGAIEGILEFLKSIGKLRQTVIAESAANGPTLEGFSNYGYTKLAERYGVKLIDLDKQEVETVWVFDQQDFRPRSARLSKMLLDRRNYIISAAKMKTHDRVVATLSLKNMVFGAPIKDEGFRWGGKGKPGAKNDKPIVHGSGFRALNYNLFALAPRLHPHLAVIDGYDGMEGNGPTAGTAVDHRICVVSPDWLAADRVAVELMGIDFSTVGYLNFCGQAGFGQTDLARIEIVGEPIAKHIRRYQLHKNIEQQLIWMKPAQVTGNYRSRLGSPELFAPCSGMLG